MDVYIENQLNHSLQSGWYLYVKVDEIYLCLNWNGLVENVVVLVRISVNQDEYS